MKPVDKEYLAPRLLHRSDVSHKGDYGHLLLVCGCDSMPGAASLATSAALKSGCGLVTLHTSAFAAQICAVANPSAILSTDAAPYFSGCSLDLSRYTAVAVGPGLGRRPESALALERLLVEAHDLQRPMVIDADAINLIAADQRLRSLVPAGSILTPHDGELGRLISWTSPADKALKTQQLADSLGCTVVSKGYHTKIYVAGSSEVYENTTGNAGMAKGGSGDVLTGLIGGLLARGYSSTDAAVLGVYIHGFAGDCCTSSYGAEAYSSRELVDCIYLGFNNLYK